MKIRVQILVQHNHGSRLDYMAPDEWLDVPDGMTPEHAALHALERVTRLLERKLVVPAEAPHQD